MTTTERTEDAARERSVNALPGFARWGERRRSLKAFRMFLAALNEGESA